MKVLSKIISVLWSAISLVVAGLFVVFFINLFSGSNGIQLPAEVVELSRWFIQQLRAFLGSAAFFLVFVIFWFIISYHLSKKSGWRNLAVDYADSGAGSALEFSTVNGTVGSVSYQGSLQVSAHPLGLALRVFIPFRFGSKNLHIPWAAIESITVSRFSSTSGQNNFLEKLTRKFSRARYAHFRFAVHPNQTRIILWKEEICAGIPSYVNLIIQDD